ncbi:histidine phosphatase family protein [Lysinibacillus telephonicus]|uniref:Fructose-2,6-bisphosphatase n=1 Tax=Lysinibacillus telephonicus TaxID=1714840 RepID=A0A431UJ53_9BACI|nr:histidine phosphatase family protein [Lysinibacillus telephonicus]RTQ89452.1 fructose-2,6-bisphosphatase [Lysinibacillus telephonicus]
MGHSVTVHLIRHEKTAANIERKYIGWTDESIVINKCEYQLPIQPANVYGSDLKRCKETAKLYFPTAYFHPLEKFREINFGDFEMKTYEQLKENPMYRQWIDSPETVIPPNGESFANFTERIVHQFRQIVSAAGDYCFIVHGGVIRVLLSMIGPKEESFQQIDVQHRLIYTLQWSTWANFEGGARCESLSVEPIMEKENL